MSGSADSCRDKYDDVLDKDEEDLRDGARTYYGSSTYLMTVREMNLVTTLWRGNSMNIWEMGVQTTTVPEIDPTMIP